MSGPLYPEPSPELARRRRELAPDAQAAFDAFSRQVFAPGALDTKTNQLIAVAVAHVTQCPYCIQGHTELASREGAAALRRVPEGPRYSVPDDQDSHGLGG